MSGYLDRVEILDWLSKMTFVEEHQGFLDNWQEGTCAWFQGEPDFVRWAQGEIKTLWCRGGRKLPR